MIMGSTFINCLIKLPSKNSLDPKSVNGSI
jgi:hypothetical protein